MILFCSNCGKEIPENSKFCPYCGHEVVINRNLVEEPKAEEPVKEEPKPVVEAPVAEIKPEVRQDNSELIAKYEDEIRTYERRRSGLAIPGGIILGIFLILTIVFAALYTKSVADYAIDTYNPETIDFENLPVNVYAYFAALSISAILSDAGLALLLVGIIPNSIKITKRRNKIDQLKGYRK